MTEADAYCEGWNACYRDEDGSFTNPYPHLSIGFYAWIHGFHDAMESEEGEEPCPDLAGYAVPPASSAS